MFFLDAPTKYLVADAVGPLSFEALSNINCLQAPLSKMKRSELNSANRHPIAPRSLEDLVRTPEYIIFIFGNRTEFIY